MKLLAALVVLVMAGMTGCTVLDPKLVDALAKDNASFCMNADIRGGSGVIVMPAPTGGYGQGTIAFCRSNRPNTELSITPDGGIHLKNGSN